MLTQEASCGVSNFYRLRLLLHARCFLRQHDVPFKVAGYFLPFRLPPRLAPAAQKLPKSLFILLAHGDGFGADLHGEAAHRLDFVEGHNERAVDA